MATSTPVITKLGKYVMTIQWPAMATGDTATPVDIAHYKVVSVQATGTFNGGTAIAFTGSNDGTNYAALQDEEGAAWALTAAGIKSVLEKTRYITPTIASGSADAVVITALCHLAN